jgi:transposase-like protein
MDSGRSGMQNAEVDRQRWTAKRKAAVVLEVLRGLITSVEASRKYGIPQAEIDRWRELYTKAGEDALGRMDHEPT